MSREVLRNYNRRLNILNKINNMKLKIKKNDLFKEYESTRIKWVKIKKKEMDKFLNKIITKNGTTKY